MTQTDPTAKPTTPGRPTPMHGDLPEGSGWPLPIPEAEAFINREVSWLEFNRRVLHEALDARTPLLERVAFLAIFNSNLDEYYQKRVGSLKRQVSTSPQQRGPDNLSAADQVAKIREMVVPMLHEQAECFEKQIKPELAEHGIHLLKWGELTDAERAEAEQHFMDNLFPVLTPLAVDPGHPFPFISNLSTSLGVMLRTPPGDPLAAKTDPSGGFGLQFARVKVPEVLPGWVRLNAELKNEDGLPIYRFITLTELIHHNLHHLFEGMEIQEIEPFRVTRNAAVGSSDEDAEDLLEVVNEELRQRRFADVVRLEVDDNPFRPLNRYLIQEMDLKEQDIYEMPGELDYNDLWVVHAAADVPELKYESWTPVTPPRLADEDASIFNVIRSGDVMVHHPYESFSKSVERFISEACTDPNVIAIKLTLYRTAKDSPFIPDLIRAAESGKQVVVLVELKARFDEERNVELARRLEKAGIHVVYGVVGLKTHTKTSLVVRQESDGLRTYAHIGSGNYNSKTANLYTDLGLFTCDPRLTGDLVQMFHFLTGRSIQKDFKHLLIAPTNMRRRFTAMIEREIRHAKAITEQGGDPRTAKDGPRIIAKMNSLEDRMLCHKLYEASDAGVRVDLIVRGFCCLRPGVPGLSENITVTSVIGRFLEHSRIYYFHNAGNPEFYTGSADWMYRNLNNRVECITPIYDPSHQRRLYEILEIMFADQRQSWDMQPDGSYVQRQPSDPRDPTAVGTHRSLMDLTRLEQINRGG
ncbi:MAG: polyphosphate kinase 1 [Phycisphaerales bacterium JB063]